MTGEHTCIKDDGGTPGRKCLACAAERPQVPACKFPGCIANANTGRDHCTTHYPENVAHRAVVIVTTHLHPLVSRKQPFVTEEKTEGFQKRITTIRDEICAAIKRTT